MFAAAMSYIMPSKVAESTPAEEMQPEEKSAVIVSSWETLEKKEDVPKFEQILAEQIAEKIEEEAFENYVKKSYEGLSQDELNTEALPFELVKYEAGLERDFYVSSDDSEDENSTLESDTGRKYEHDPFDFPLYGPFSSKFNRGCRRRTKSEGSRKRLVKIDPKVEKLSSIDYKSKNMVTQFIRKSVIEGIFGVISVTRDCTVLGVHGGTYKSKTGVINLPKNCVMKIFVKETEEPENETEKTRKDQRHCSKLKQQLVPLKAKNEMYNLNRLRSAGIPCPKVFLVHKHILICEFLGFNMVSSSDLKHATATPEAEGDQSKKLIRNAYAQVLQILYKMYNLCQLVHGDISEYTVFFDSGVCYLKNAGHALPVEGAASAPCHEMLFRDCCRVFEFFSKKGLNDLSTPDAMFREITGFKYCPKKDRKVSDNAEIEHEE